MADPVAFDIAVLYGILFECMFYGERNVRAVSGRADANCGTSFQASTSPSLARRCTCCSCRCSVPGRPDRRRSTSSCCRPRFSYSCRSQWYVLRLCRFSARELMPSPPQHFCINMARIYGAYVVHGAEPYGPILFFADLKSPLSLVWAACYVFEAFITDSLTVRLPLNSRLSSRSCSLVYLADLPFVRHLGKQLLGVHSPRPVRRRHAWYVYPERDLSNIG